MDEIWKTLSSPAWWITAVAFGILVNLVSAYLKDPLDSLVAKFFKAWRTRSEKARENYKARLAFVASNTDEQLHVLMEALHFRSKSNGWLIVAGIWAGFYALALQIRTSIVLTAIQLKQSAEVDSILTNVAILLGTAAAILAMRNAFAAVDREELVKRARSLARNGGAAQEAPYK